MIEHYLLNNNKIYYNIFLLKCTPFSPTKHTVWSTLTRYSFRPAHIRLFTGGTSSRSRARRPSRTNLRHQAEARPVAGHCHRRLDQQWSGRRQIRSSEFIASSRERNPQIPAKSRACSPHRTRSPDATPPHAVRAPLSPMAV